MVAGPERERLERMAAEGGWGRKITFAGQLSFPEVQARLAQARLLVLPSLCFEGFPMAIREAFALGVPVAGSRLGSIPCIVQEGTTGILFMPGDAEDLLARVKTLWEEPDRLAAMGKGARDEFAEHYTAEANYRQLMNIYGSALKRRRQSTSVDGEGERD